jgi:ubiquinol-cytochrome c reductase cytochrome b/c1 subunit
MSFNYSFVIKDMINCAAFFLFFLFIFVAPYKLGDPENFILANPLMSPLHIQPE